MQFIKPLFVLALCSAAVLSGCGKEEPATTTQPQTETSAPASTSPAVAVVNGKPITQEMLDGYVKRRLGKVPEEFSDEQRQNLINEFVNQELLVQDAEKEGLDRDPDVLAELEVQRRLTLAGAAAQKYLEDHPITDEAMKQEYDTQVAKNVSKEYKARHILVPSEEEAKAVIVELDNGADFAELAKEKSTGPSGKDGGDLGWFSPRQMVKPFSDAVAGMEKGSYTKAPVQTEFGWHVILLEDVRDMTPPSFDDVKDRLHSFMQNRLMQQYVQDLHANAQIELK